MLIPVLFDYHYITRQVSGVYLDDCLWMNRCKHCIFSIVHMENSIR